MELQQPHVLQRYWDLALAAVQADALDAALDMGLLDALCEPASAADVAARLGLDAANTGHLLELLWSMGLLRRGAAAGDGADAPSYQAGADAQRYLLRQSPTFCGDAWAYRLHSLRHFGTQLRDHVRKGTGGPGAPFQTAIGQNWAAAAKAQIGQEQRAVTVAAALAVMAGLPEFHRARRCLDLGGGPGWVAIALAQASPGLHGVVFDWPETVAVAQQNIEQAGMAARLSTQGGDLAADAIGEGYDLVWCSSVLHFVPNRARVLEKIHAALRPGGLLVCAHAEIADAPQAALRVLPYYLPMMMLGRHVGAPGALAAELLQAGFAGVDSAEASDFPMAPLQVLVARRAA